MSARARVLWAWLWVGLCVVMIFTFSSESFSAIQTGGFLAPFLRWLFPEITSRQILDIHFVLRKLAHLTEYAVLAMLSLRALRLTIDVPVLRVVGLTLLIVLGVAGLDELRQSYLPARTGSPIDVCINLVGGGIGVLLVILVHRVFGVGAPAPKEGT